MRYEGFGEAMTCQEAQFSGQTKVDGALCSISYTELTRHSTAFIVVIIEGT